MKAPRKSPKAWIVPAILSTCVFCFLAWVQWRLRDMLFDDAMIHLRIAKNLALHGQAFFNPGERIMATSSPLWTIILAGTGLATHAQLLPFFEAALLTAAGFLAFSLTRAISQTHREKASVAINGSQNSVRAVLPAVLTGLLTIVFLLPSALGQMETPLVMVFFLAAMCSFAESGSSALPLFALAACTRLELLPLLLVVCLGALMLKRHRISLIVAIGIVAAVAAGVYQQFGVLMPNSVRAKSIGYAYGRVDILQQIFQLRYLDGPLGICLLIFLIGIVGDQLPAFRRSPLMPTISLPTFAGFCGTLVALEYIVRRMPIFEWYWPLIWLPLMLCFLLYRRQFESPRRWHKVMEVARFVGIPLLILVPSWKFAMIVNAAIQQTPVSKWAFDRGDSARVDEYLAVGRMLRATCPDGKLMTAEIGALGWAFDGYIYDAFGIASPGALAFQPLRSGAPLAGIPSAFAEEVSPDIIVSYTSLGVEVLRAPQLMAKYRLVALPPWLPADRDPAITRGWHDSPNLNVMLLNGGACPTEAVENVLRHNNPLK